MVALGVDIISGGVATPALRSRLLGAALGGTTVTSAATFRIITCTPLNSNTVRVYFSREPKHVSPLAPNDALYRPNWSIVLTTGALGVTEPVVEAPSNVRPATAEEVDLVAYPEAHSIDVQFDRRIIWNSTYTITAATAIRSADLVDDLTPASTAIPPANECTFPGIFIQRPRRLTRAARTRTGVDLQYSFFRGVFGVDSGNDLDTESGNVALKKRVIRRLMSTPGGFPHLPEYGVGLRVKEPLQSTSLSELRTRIRDQILEEPEVADAEVFLDRPVPDVLIVLTNITTSAEQSFALRFNVPSNGAIRVAA